MKKKISYFLCSFGWLPTDVVNDNATRCHRKYVSTNMIFYKKKTSKKPQVWCNVWITSELKINDIKRLPRTSSVLSFFSTNWAKLNNTSAFFRLCANKQKKTTFYNHLRHGVVKHTRICATVYLVLCNIF